MNNKKIDQIKRILYLEEKINQIRLKYPCVEELSKSQKILFMSKRIVEIEVLTIEDWEYFNIACIIPLSDIQKELENYDNSKPKLDELTFINDLIDKYNVNKNVILTRIKEVRRIQKLYGEENNNIKDKPKVKKIVKK